MTEMFIFKTAFTARYKLIYTVFIVTTISIRTATDMIMLCSEPIAACFHVYGFHCLSNCETVRTSHSTDRWVSIVSTHCCHLKRLYRLEIVTLVTFYNSAVSVFLNVLLLTGVFLRYRYITIVT